MYNLDYWRSWRSSTRRHSVQEHGHDRATCPSAMVELLINRHTAGATNRDSSTYQLAG
jgi:hypothetical protein